MVKIDDCSITNNSQDVDFVKQAYICDLSGNQSIIAKADTGRERSLESESKQDWQLLS